MKTRSGIECRWTQGEHTVTLTATDAAGNVSDSFTLRVLPFREAAPTGEPRGPAPGEPYETIVINATEDQDFQFNIPMNIFVAPGENPDDFSFSAKLVNDDGLPGWIRFRRDTLVDPQSGEETQVLQFEGTPLNQHVGLNRFELTARDCAGTAITAQFHVSVANVNDGPVARRPGGGGGGGGGAGGGVTGGVGIGQIPDQVVEATEPMFRFAE